MAIMEVIGIASIMPFLSVVADPTEIHKNELLSWLYNRLSFASQNSFLLFIGFSVLVMFLLTNSFSALVTWSILRFTGTRNYGLSRRLLAHYLFRPYVFFLNRNTADLGKNILSEVDQVVSGILIPGMQIFARITVIVFVLTMLLIIDPVITLTVITALGGTYGAIYALVRVKLLRIGKDRVVANLERYKVAAQAFGSIKEVKLLGKERFFIELYSQPCKRYANHKATSSVIGQVPRYAVETFAFGGIMLFVIYYLTINQDLSKVLPMIGLYAFSGYRIIPALQKVFTAMTNMKFNACSLKVISEEFQEMLGNGRYGVEMENAGSPLSLQRSLELKNITFAYPDSKRTLFDNLDLCIKANHFVGLAGLTGAGKTTLIDIILGLLRPQHGCLLADGIQIRDENLRSWQTNLGYVPQEIYLFDDTIIHNIALGVSEKDIDMLAVERSARTANVHDFIIRELPEKYETIIGERGVRLSGGQRQRIGIARALYHNPDLLIFDEATNSLDGVTEMNVFSSLNGTLKNKTVIMIAHRLTTLKECDVIYVLNQGKLIDQGSFEELARTCPRFRAMLRISPTLQEEISATQEVSATTIQ